MGKCTNCFKKYKKEKKMQPVWNWLGAEFVYIRIKKKSAHFCSKTCTNKVLAVASYPPGSQMAVGRIRMLEVRVSFLARRYGENSETVPGIRQP
ncbi:MAG: hypothetical protein QXS93_00715 [Candidatus Micrarchaeia archaeon]